MKVSDQQIRELHASGHTASGIAETTGVSTSAISQRLRKLHLTANGRGNIRDADRTPYSGETTTRVLPWLAGYSIGDDGSIWSEAGNKPRKLKPRLVSGRPRLRVETPTGPRWAYVAVLVAEAWIGPRPPGHVVHYRDNDPANVRADNLFWSRPIVQKIATDEEFVRVWQSAENVMEVSELTGLSLGTVRSKSYALRAAGVPLKKMRSGRSKNAVDIEALKKIAEEAAQ